MSEQKEGKAAPKTIKPVYKGLLHEMGIISAIVSNAFLDQVHAQIEGGLFDALEIISESSVDFYKTYRKNIENKKEDWSATCALHRVPCYDDLVLNHCARFIVNKYYSVSLKLQ